MDGVEIQTDKLVCAFFLRACNIRMRRLLNYIKPFIKTVKAHQQLFYSVIFFNYSLILICNIKQLFKTKCLVSILSAVPKFCLNIFSLKHRGSTYYYTKGLENLKDIEIRKTIMNTK